jgi:hypothetical protein
MALTFHLEIENAAGVKQGSGPITSASSWTYTARMDAAGDFKFSMPANDPKAVYVQKKLIVRAYALLPNGTRTEVGAGIIDSITKQPQDDGTASLQVSGNDLIRELNYRSVLNLKLYTGGSPVTHSAAVAAVAGYAPSGWTITADSTPPNNSVYGYFNGETVLTALIKTGEKSQNHFYRGAGRTLNFASTFTVSGIRAIKAGGDLVANTCAITALTENVNLFDMITRIYPRGSGNADAQLTLKASTRTAPSGYTVDKNANYIENTTYATTYGRIESQLDFRDIGPISNTTADVVSAANMLFDAALETLKRRSVELDDKSYTLELAGCSQLLRPMQTIRVVYRDLPSAMDINRDLNILQATWSASKDGIFTTAVIVSTADRPAQSDQSVLVNTVAAGRIYQALPQLNANSYVTAYRANVDKDNIASFRFRFGNEVTQLQQVLYEFQLLSFESTVKSIGGSSGGSGSLPTTGPDTNTSGASSGANNTSGAPSVANSGAPSLNTSGAPSTNNSSTPSSNTSGTASGNTGAASGATGASTGFTSIPSINDSSGPSVPDTGTPSAISTGAPDTANTSGPSANISGAASGTTNAATGSTAGPNNNTSGSPSVTDTGGGVGSSDAPSTDLSGGPSSDSTGNATGGDTTTVDGKHDHGLTILAGSGNIGPVTLHHSGSNYFLSAGLLADTTDINVHDSGSHTHSLGAHTHSLGGHTHSLSGHTHGLSSHTHSLNSHTHDLASHTHDLNGHQHTLNAHTHDLANHSHGLGHTHDLGNHTHSMMAHAHGLNNHTHDLNSHTHTLGGHTHDLGNHTHDLALHTHTLGGHTHDLGNHTHSLSAHTHSLSNHIHSLADSIVALYGIFRDSAANTFATTDLQYRVNGGSWQPLSGATSIGSGWFRLDLTSAVVDATTFRPVQENNLLEIGPVSSTLDKRATIDAQLSVRDIIQSIAYN